MFSQTASQSSLRRDAFYFFYVMQNMLENKSPSFCQPALWQVELTLTLTDELRYCITNCQEIISKQDNFLKWLLENNYRMSFLSNHHPPVVWAFVVVVVAHIDSPGTRQHQTLTIGRLANFLLR